MKKYKYKIKYKIIFESEGLHLSYTTDATSKKQAEANFKLFAKCEWNKILTIIETL